MGGVRRQAGISALKGAGHQVPGGEQLHGASLYVLLLVLFFSSFAVLTICLYSNPQVLPFSSDSPPHPTGQRGGASSPVVLCCQLRLNHQSKQPARQGVLGWAGIGLIFRSHQVG